MNEQIEQNAIETANEKPSEYSNFKSDETHGRQPMATGRWIADDDGVRTYGGKDGKQIITACPEPLRPIKRYRNIQTDRERVEIAIGKNLNRTVIVDRSTLATPNKIVLLSDYGVPIDSNMARNTMDYMTTCLLNDRFVIPVVNGTSKLGWLKRKDGTFIKDAYGHIKFAPYCSDIVCDTTTANDGLTSYIAALKPRGSFEDWRNFVDPYRSKLAVRITMAAAFASVLLDLCNSEVSFILHLFGLTDSGKSSIQRLAASIWGNPSGGNGIVRSLNATQNALAAAASFLNNLPFFGDELGVLRKQVNGKYVTSDYDGLIYSLCNGAGRQRCNADATSQSVGEWKCAFITSGEIPLRTQRQENGAQNRVIQLELEQGTISPDEGALIANFVHDNYGTAGERYVKGIQQTDIDILQSTVTMFQTEILEKTGASGKQSLTAALLLTADEYARQFVWENDNYQLTVEDLKPFLLKASDLDKARVAYEYAKSLATTNVNNFIDLHKQLQSTGGKVYGKLEGYIKNEEQIVTKVCFIKNVLVDLLTAAGFDFDSVKSEWVKRGFIETDYNEESKKDKRITIKKRIRGISENCIVLVMTDPERPATTE